MNGLAKTELKLLQAFLQGGKSIDDIIERLKRTIRDTVEGFQVSTVNTELPHLL